MIAGSAAHAPKDNSAIKAAESMGPSRQGRRARAHAARAAQEEPRSRHTREECTSYALTCEAAGQDIRSPFGFGLSLYRSGNQDDEVELFLKTGEIRKAYAA
jgi:hypothetical protein